MTTSRRRLLQALSLTAAHQSLYCGGATEGQQPSVETLRAASTLQANPLDNGRLKTIRPAVERNLAQIEPVRAFEFDELTEPITLFHPRG